VPHPVIVPPTSASPAAEKSMWRSLRVVQQEGAGARAGDVPEEIADREELTASGILDFLPDAERDREAGCGDDAVPPSETGHPGTTGAEGGHDEACDEVLDLVLSEEPVPWGIGMGRREEAGGQ